MLEPGSNGREQSVFMRTTAAAAYPSAVDGYAPDTAYPELPHVKPIRRPNEVYAAVRLCLADAGLDAGRFGTPEWNPFSDLVQEGGRVFVLCNFCYHRRPWESEATFFSKCTHGSVLRPILDYACKAVGPNGTVEFGNSPIQSANWNALLAETGAADVVAYFESRKHGPSVRAVDLRSWVLKGQMRGTPQESSKVTIDLGVESLLERTTKSNYDYRVLQYDPALTALYHGDKRHLYVLSRAVLEANLVVSVPKLKTHQKVGLTVALKGLVGMVPDKDCLAHHRRGTPAQGGDEFPSDHPVALIASRIGEFVWRRDAGNLVRLARFAERFAGILSRKMGLITYGGWHGNDTAWRMALDINRCMRAADASGLMHDRKQREHVVLIDGVIGGEGEGPLDPSPAPSRCVIFARDALEADVAAAAAMGMDPRKLRILRDAEGVFPYPVSEARIDEVRVSVDGATPLPALSLGPRLGRSFRAPDGWRGAVELDVP